MLWRKLVTPTVAVSALWLAVGGATVYYLDWVYHSHSRDLADNFAAIQAADAMQDVLWQLQATAIEVAERADSHTRFEVIELERTFERHLAAAGSGSVTPEERALVDAIAERFSAYRQRIHTRLYLDSPSGPAGAPPVELSRSAHAVAELCQSLLKVQERLIAESTAQRGRLHAAFSNVMLVLWVFGPTVGIGFGLWIAHRLKRSISQISINLTDAASGLHRAVGQVDVTPSDDLPALHEQVQRVSSRIAQVLDELQQARHEAMLADRLAAVGEMAAGVAHELRNPLTSVKLLMQTAADDPADRAMTHEHVHVVLEQVIRMENTIQGLLDFASPPQMQCVRHDVRDTLQRALNLVEGLAKQQGITVVNEWPTTPVFVKGDPEQLHQVFVNLLLNGVEAMPAGGQLQTAVQRIQAAQPVTRVLFRDDGGGIPTNIMPRLFEPFVTGKEHGTGLGLAISRRIVEQHGGTLTAANRPLHGAEFTVELPLAGEDRRRSDVADDDLVSGQEALHA